MSLADCLNTAVQGGELKPEIAQKVAKEYEALRQKYAAKPGVSAAEAERAAGDDIIERITKDVRARRHATLHQLRVMEANQLRYGAEPWKNPGLIRKDTQAVRDMSRVVERHLFGTMHDALKAFHTNALGVVRNRALLKEVVMELHGQASGNPAAKELATAITATFEKARAWANSLGMDIGKLEDFGLPHSHDAARLRKAGFDAWFRELYDSRRLDWSRIIDPRTEKPFAVAKGSRPLRQDAEAYLKDRFDAIVTDGWAFREPSMAFKGTSFAARHSEHRSLHFLSGEDWWAYNEVFGRSNPLDAILNHVKAMSREIALMQKFGPNPKMGLDHAIQVVEAASATADLGDKARKHLNSELSKAKLDLALLTGEANKPVDETIARAFGATRNLMVAANLAGAAFWTPFDHVNSALAARMVGQSASGPFMQSLKSMFGRMSPQDAAELGLLLETWTDGLSAQARQMGENIWAPEFSRRITGFVFRASLMNMVTDHNRRGIMHAFGLELGADAGKTFDHLDSQMQTFMRANDIGPADWDAMRAHLYTDRAGGRNINDKVFLTRTSLPEDQARDIALRWGAMVEQHADMTMNVNNQRVATGLHVTPGDLGGEISKGSLRMFKSYSFNFIANQARRIAQIQGVPNKYAYGVAVLGITTITGAVMLSLEDIRAGRDPRPWDSGPFWYAAFLKGGGLGIIGDLFFADASRAGGGPVETLAGPIAGLVGQTVRTGQAAISGDNFGGEAVRLARSVTPGANYQPPLPLPTRLAIERLFWDQLQLWLDPGAPERFRRDARRRQKEFGQGYFWRKGELVPDRAPDLSNILGGTP